MSETLLDIYFNRLKEDRNYLINHEEWTGGLFNGPWDLREDDNEIRIEIKYYRYPVLGMMIVSILLFLMAALMARFAYNHDDPLFVYIIFPIAFLTSIVLISIGFAIGRSLKKKGRCWFVWNKRQDSVSLPRRNISFSCADILALQYREPGGEDNSYFEVVVFSRGNLQRIHVLEFWGAPSEVRIIHDTARFLKKPLIRIPYSGKDAPVVWKEHCQENES